MTDGFFQEVPLPADALRRAREIAEESRFDEALKIDGAVVAVGAQRPDEFGNFLRIAETRTIAPLIRVDRDESNIQAAELDSLFVFPLHEPVDFCVGKGLPELRDGRQAMDDVAKRTELHDQKAVEVWLCHFLL